LSSFEISLCSRLLSGGLPSDNTTIVALQKNTSDYILKEKARQQALAEARAENGHHPDGENSHNSSYVRKLVTF